MADVIWRKIIQELYCNRYKFTATDIKIVLSILDAVDYGKKIGTELSLKTLTLLIANGTKNEKRNVTKELKKLIEMNVVNVIEDFSVQYRYGRVLSINSPDKWFIIGGNLDDRA